MTHLTSDADQLVRASVDAFLAGTLKPDPLPETLYSTKNSTYRVIAGRIHEATDMSLMGAELVAFLVEEGRSFRVEPSWAAKARAIFFERTSRDVVVTSRIVKRAMEAPSRDRTPTPGPIPAAPPVPLFKNGPPPVQLAESATLPKFAGSKPEEEITKVELTAAMDSDKLEVLRDSSANLGDSPPTKRSEPPARPSEPPTMRIPGPPVAPPRPSSKPRVIIDETGDDAPTKLAPDVKRRLPPVKPPPHKKK